MNQLPHLKTLYNNYLTEDQPFRKVHRMIDLFESIIKTHTVLILAGYVKHNKLSDKAKGLLSQGLRTPSLGTWQLFSRVLFEELVNDNYIWISNSFADEFRALDKALQSEKTNVIAFRNGYAHGATPTDAQCETDIQKFNPFLMHLMQYKWLEESSLEVQEGETWIISAKGSLSLHPILLYRKENSEASYAFFNDLKNEKIGLLNYTLSKHYKEKELFTEFHKHLPLHEWKKSGNNEFYQRIEELTETFKGRTFERNSLIQFVLKNSKGYFSIQGNPGIGKSALIAQFIKDLRVHPELKNIKVIEYFIRRGTQQAQVEYLLNYLIRCTDEVFEEGRDIRAEGKMVFDLQNQLFSKWHRWGEQNKGQQLLFLIDGLDEGVENNLVTYLPRENFKNILFIYGSRPGGHKSIDDLWAQLPVLNHTKLELAGLGIEDIRGLIYEVANKYEIDRESAWIDAVQLRSQGNPLYLKLLCDAIENGSISINDINALPKEINEYYKAILLRYAQDSVDGDALLAALFTFAAAKDYLTFAHLELINHLGPATLQRIGSTLKEVLYENPSTENVLDYQLFHESFREYLVRENQKQVIDATGRIIDFCINWKDLSGTWEQRYAFEHLASHLSESKKQHHHELLLELIYNQAYVNEQNKILKNFDSSTQLYQLGLLKASELDNFDNTLEAALCLVDLHYEEANDAPQIVKMIANGDIDLALKRIERFGGTDQEGIQRKFILYMLCLMEFTLFGSKDNPFKFVAIEKLLNHLDEHIPMYTYASYWDEFFPISAIVNICNNLKKLDKRFISILESRINQKYPFQKHVKSGLKNRISWLDEIKWEKENAIELALNGNFNKAVECAESLEYSSDFVRCLCEISSIQFKNGYIDSAKSILEKSINFVEDQADIDKPYWTAVLLKEISIEMYNQSLHFESKQIMQKSIEWGIDLIDEYGFKFHFKEIIDFYALIGFNDEVASCCLIMLKSRPGIVYNDERNELLCDITRCLINQNRLEDAKFLINEQIGNDFKVSLLSELSTAFWKNQNEKLADSAINEAIAISLQENKEKHLTAARARIIITELVKQSKIEKAIQLAKNSENEIENLMLILENCMTIGEKNEANNLLIIEKAIQLAKNSENEIENLILILKNCMTIGEKNEANNLLILISKLILKNPINEIFDKSNLRQEEIINHYLRFSDVLISSEASILPNDIFNSVDISLLQQCHERKTIELIHEWKTIALITNVLILQGKIDEVINLDHKEIHHFYRAYNYLKIKNKTSAKLLLSEHVICLIKTEPNLWDVENIDDELVELVPLFALEESLQNAVELSYSISNVLLRHMCWKDLGRQAMIETDFQSITANINKLEKEEARLFYLQGCLKYYPINEINDYAILNVLPTLTMNKKLIENFLIKFSIRKLFLGEPSELLMAHLNKKLNIQWAINIKERIEENKNFFNEIFEDENRGTFNLESWIHEIADEDDRDQIELWARQVLKGKLSEEEFKNNLESI
jgi:hypothetical protein